MSRNNRKIVCKYHSAGDYYVTDGVHSVRVCKVSVWSMGEQTGDWMTLTTEDINEFWTKADAVAQATKQIEAFRNNPHFAGQVLSF